MIKVSENKQGGFTLIEIILTLVIAAVVGAGLVQYMGSAFVKSSIPIQRLRQAYELQQVMENITADYRENYTSNLSADAEEKGLSWAIGEGEQTKYAPVGGQYTVIHNVFIKFVDQGGDNYDETTPLEEGDPEDLLKVTIKNDSGILTTLFSSQ
jgi:prepilin-type N-terminal cleavage/methylation domain-containing protein